MKCQMSMSIYDSKQKRSERTIVPRTVIFIMLDVYLVNFSWFSFLNNLKSNLWSQSQLFFQFITKILSWIGNTLDPFFCKEFGESGDSGEFDDLGEPIDSGESAASMHQQQQRISTFATTEHSVASAHQQHHHISSIITSAASTF